MLRYSTREGRWYGKARSNVTVPEGTRDDRKWHVELPGGLVRIDYGAPIPRHPSETQPVPVARPLEAPAGPASVAPAPARISVRPMSRKDHRDHRAITREA